MPVPCISGKKNRRALWTLGLDTIKALEVKEGILASGKEEIYGCIFGRDSLITAMKLLRVYERTMDGYFAGLVRNILLHLVEFQGKTVNIESGEEPGKCIHEYRPSRHEHLTAHPEHPWYLYPDNVMRNYDTVDATPLFLVAAREYSSVTGDSEFLAAILPAVKAGLEWLMTYADSNQDGFIDYRFHPDRKFGGLLAQSWMDSHESLFHEDGSPIAYPIAPVEAQAYAYVAFSSWSDYFIGTEPELGKKLGERAAALKARFNERYPVEYQGRWSLAFALDGNQKPLSASRSSIGHVLWAVRRTGAISDGRFDTILREEDIPKLVSRLMSPDMFEPKAGIRTLSALSTKYEPNSYHNGSIWPHDTSMVIEGLRNFGYLREAGRVKRALLRAYRHFGTPIEMFTCGDDGLSEYRSPNGQTACRQQAWSAAALLHESAPQARRRALLPLDLNPGVAT